MARAYYNDNDHVGSALRSGQFTRWVRCATLDDHFWRLRAGRTSQNQRRLPRENIHSPTVFDDWQSGGLNHGCLGQNAVGWAVVGYDSGGDGVVHAHGRRAVVRCPASTTIPGRRSTSTACCSSSHRCAPSRVRVRAYGDSQHGRQAARRHRATRRQRSPAVPLVLAETQTFEPTSSSTRSPIRTRRTAHRPQAAGYRDRTARRAPMDSSNWSTVATPRRWG